MAELSIVSVEDVGNDVLLVKATTLVPAPTDDDEHALVEVTLVARGHVSATTNHYDESAYVEMAVVSGDWRPVDAKTPADAVRDVHRRDGARARSMTPAEVGEYARQLIVEQNELAPAPATAIAFEAPTTTLE